jgi:hypothetical protein
MDTAGCGDPRERLPEDFVAACLIWDPKEIVADEWISQVPLAPQFLGGDPHGRGIGETLYYLECAKRAVALLEPHMQEWHARDNDDSTPILVGDEAVPALEESARFFRTMADMLEHHQRAVRESGIQAPGPGFWYVPIWPGMTSTEWRLLEPQVLEVAELSLREQVHELAASGYTKAAAANLLGVSRRAVQRCWPSDAAGTEQETA